MLVATEMPDSPCKLKTIADAAGIASDIIPADLARVMEAWPALPEPVRTAILAIVDRFRTHPPLQPE